MGETEDRLRVLEDKDEIRELTARYCLAIAAGDVEKIVTLFCPDGAFVTSAGESVGSDELRRFYDRGGTTNKPFVQNHVIEVSGDEAVGRCAVEVRMVSDGEAYTAAGEYVDLLRRVDGRWLFASRDFRPYHRARLSDGWA
jgi:uncharacterized protein (TIGR02246 family)